jgi:hypothetical protein
VSTNTLSLNSIGDLLFTGNSSIERMRITGSGNITASALGGVSNDAIPSGFDRVLLANSSGQFNQLSLGSLWSIFGNNTSSAWNGSTGSFLGTTSEQPLVLATTNATAQDIKFFTGNNGANERMRITGSGNIVIPILGGTVNGSAPGGYDRVLLANSSGQLSQVDISVLSGGGGSMLLTPQSTPANPTSGALVYSEPLAGRALPFYITQSGRRKAIGAAWFGKQTPVEVGIAGGTTAPVTLGASVITAATISYQYSPISTNRYLSMPRKRYNTSTANATTGIRQDYTQFYSGNAPGYGGVFFSTRFGVNTNKLSTVFVGLTSSTVALVGNASALTNMIGMGYDLTDPTTSNWFLMKNNGAGTAQKINLLATNAARGTDIGFELNLYNPPNSTDWYVYIVNLNTGAVVLDTFYTSDVEVPVVNTGLTWKAEIRNDAVATNANIEHNYIYVEPQGW